MCGPKQTIILIISAFALIIIIGALVMYDRDHATRMHIMYEQSRSTMIQDLIEAGFTKVEIMDIIHDRGEPHKKEEFLPSIPPAMSADTHTVCKVICHCDPKEKKFYN